MVPAPKTSDAHARHDGPLNMVLFICRTPQTMSYQELCIKKMGMFSAISCHNGAPSLPASYIRANPESKPGEISLREINQFPGRNLSGFALREFFWKNRQKISEKRRANLGHRFFRPGIIKKIPGGKKTGSCEPRPKCACFCALLFYYKQNKTGGLKRYFGYFFFTY